jgi:hypothetical protein
MDCPSKLAERQSCEHRRSDDYKRGVEVSYEVCLAVTARACIVLDFPTQSL